MQRSTPGHYLSPHFRLDELTFSQAAVRQGLDNTPGPEALANLGWLATVLEDVRRCLGCVPIVVSSGYRSRLVNAAVGGSLDSAHTRGLAADFTAPRYGTPLQVCRHLAELPFYDLLIFEGGWVHLGLAPEGTLPRRQLLTAHFNPGRPATYSQGLPV